MKSLIDKFFAKMSNWEPLFLIIPFVLWVFCFRHFFSGHVGLQQDAVSYAANIKYYTDNLSKGVYPLWYPEWFSGAPYHFFLRRIGDVNPLLFLIVGLKWLGISSASAYLVFLGMYYFLAGWAIYLITRFLLVDRFFAFSAYVLFLFSSWGPEIFYNYIIIIFVPIVWFFYFLLCFFRKPQKGYLLGMCFCTGLILTTYIPFFFVTILVLFSLLFLLFYLKDCIDFLKRSFVFFRKNKIFTCFCIIFLLVSCIPPLVFYKESKSDGFVLPGRHSGPNVYSSAVAVGLEDVATGDLVNHGFIDHLFNDHKYLDMGDIFMPYIFFIILLIVTFARVNKLIIFLLFNIIGLFLVSITSASGVHRFLYDHILFFKIIRNIYYFFWLAILPMGILLLVSAFRSLLAVIDHSSKKTAWLVYIIICHLIFVLFLCRHQDVLIGAWAAVLISLSYFLVYFFCREKISYRVGFVAILLAVFIQSVQVYGFLSDRMYQLQQDSIHFYEAHKSPKKARLPLYYTSHWFEILVDYLDPAILDDYRGHLFILYDNVLPYEDSLAFLNIFEKSIASKTNIAYIPKSESSPADWISNPVGAPQAEDDPVSSGDLMVLSNDVNTWKLKTHFSSSRFLVINDNYNSAWHAFINGHPAHLFRANVSFKGLWVPSGQSEIVLRFSNPMSYMLHIALIILFAVTFLYLLVLLRTYV